MRHLNRKLGLFCILGCVALSAVACSGDDDGTDDITTPRDGGPDSERDGGPDSERDGGPARDAGPPRDAGEEPAFDAGCTIEENIDPTPDPACNGTTGTWTTKISGRVLDGQGNPADGAGVNICLTDARTNAGTCLIPRPVCSDGRYEVMVPSVYRCAEHMVSRAFDQDDYSAFTYCDIAAGAVELEVTEPVRLFTTEAATTLPPEGTVTEERTVVFADGLELDVVPDDFPAPYDLLGARRIAQANVCTLAGGPAYDGIYALSPETDLPGVTFPVRVPNTTNLPANSSVRMYVLGGLLCSVERPGMDEYIVDESEWYEFGSATVSADGTMIEGAELPCIGWFAYRP